MSKVQSVPVHTAETGQVYYVGLTSPLTLADLEWAAGTVNVILIDAVRVRISRCREFIDRCWDDGAQIYGLTIGLGPPVQEELAELTRGLGQAAEMQIPHEQAVLLTMLARLTAAWLIVDVTAFGSHRVPQEDCPLVDRPVRSSTAHSSSARGSGR